MAGLFHPSQTEVSTQRWYLSLYYILLPTSSSFFFYFGEKYDNYQAYTCRVKKKRSFLYPAAKQLRYNGVKLFRSLTVLFTNLISDFGYKNSKRNQQNTGLLSYVTKLHDNKRLCTHPTSLVLPPAAETNSVKDEITGQPLEVRLWHLAVELEMINCVGWPASICPAGVGGAAGPVQGIHGEIQEDLQQRRRYWG